MTYDRYEGRGGWREPRSRYSRELGERYENRGYGRGWDRDDDDRDRGFFERAGDEIASWFGDEEAERRRRSDLRSRGEDEWRRPRAFFSDDDYSRFDRQPKFRDEGYRRPYTGRFAGRRSFGGGDDRYDRDYPTERGWSERWDKQPTRDFTGTASGLHDPHYSEWRRRQIDALDRDYEDYRRENQSRFENEFSNWRSTRQTKRRMLDEVRDHMTIVGSDDEQVGVVDCVRGDQIVLTKGDSEDGRHHSLSCSLVDRIDGDRVILELPATEAKRRFDSDQRSGGFFRDEREDDRGPHILNRSFSGTYES